MASLINPNCGVPIFVQTDKTLVSTCGSYSGYIISGVITVVLIIIMIVISKSAEKYSHLSVEEQSIIKKERDNKLLMILLGILAVWVLIPMISKFLSTNRWESYQSQISQYMSQGLSRQDALSKIQSLYQTQMQANAMITAGGAIAASRAF